MAGRNRMPRQPDNFRGYRDDPRPYLPPGPGQFPPQPRALEEELELQHREIQSILAENRHLIDDNVILQGELDAVKDEIRRLSQLIPQLHADGEAQRRELIERGLKLEAELRSAETLRAEVVQLRAESQNLNALKQELSSQVQTLTKDINQLKSENQQLAALKTDIDGMRKELVEARRIFEYEKKANEELVEQNHALEKNLVSSARDIEKLRAEKRARGLDVGGYGMFNGSPEMRYPGAGYGDAYNGRRWGSYGKHGPSQR